ncbi:hypothetical protein BJY16_008132 [Actinoplanes octamycinicus]|uniref:Lipoprotein n=1 Tax=Actinoplanes octamycinicus TaxID=135948 RepID=A0A7W7H612_9ACTN|nr:hypothetical protein [Actinoplanes octamycinicus]MBB4744673.1 hypothetical protein [Actinoplanes octamycinicus]GIE55254.1 hypothetical protein Aoc01nite_06560 [Actinoplanes octamycinicus]
MFVRISMVVVLLTLTACAPDPKQGSPAPTGPAPGVQASGGQSALSGPSLDCAAPIDTLAAPPAGYTPMLDAVALSTELLQANDSGDGTLFAKTGLLIRTGHPAELLVPRGRAEVEWGNTGDRERAAHLHIPACPKFGAGDWQVYPGGYYVTAPVCLPVEVRADGRTTTIHVPVGKACPA